MHANTYTTPRAFITHTCTHEHTHTHTCTHELTHTHTCTHTLPHACSFITVSRSGERLFLCLLQFVHDCFVLLDELEEL
jgi:hypothetical protein